jgi:hypothetical protein
VTVRAQRVLTACLLQRRAVTAWCMHHPLHNHAPPPQTHTHAGSVSQRACCPGRGVRPQPPDQARCRPAAPTYRRRCAAVFCLV